MRNFLDDAIVEHNSKPPLRWIANWAGSIASRNMLELSYMEDEGLDKGFRYKYYGWLWDTFWPIYQKYGTFYKLDMDMSASGWDDYDENGVPYWEKTGLVDPDYNPWHYEDYETGDAFRILEK
jgi:hypothetical protein